MLSAPTIRGLRSAASLKRGGRAARVGGAEGDPRTQIRGLIEAWTPGAAAGTPAPIDPRTQIRGLIEAPRKTVTRTSPFHAIRGLRSAASLKRPTGRPG